MKTQCKKRLQRVLAAVLMIAAVTLTLCSCGKAAPPAEGEASVTLNVRKKDGSSVSFPYVGKTTDTLKDAMIAVGILQEDGILGGMVTVVDGETADYAADKAYWALLRDGAYMTNGCETEYLRNGAVYAIEYTVYRD